MNINLFNIIAEEFFDDTLNETRLLVQCPFCEELHNHARLNQKPYYGQYLAHCLLGEYKLWSK